MLHREPVRGRRGFLALAVCLAAAAGEALGQARPGVPGRLDVTFGSGGIVVRDLAGDADVIGSVVVQPDGRVVASGSTGVFRLDGSGATDSSFGTSGVAAAGSGGPLVLQPDGRIVVLGPTGVSRLRADGTSDTGFGTGGTAALPDPFLAPGSEVTALARQPNGKLVVGGMIGNQVALARWDSRGDIDHGFGDDGLVTTAAAPIWSRVDAVVGTTDNGLVVAGAGRFDAPVDGVRFVVARYLADGSPDPSFGGGGVVTTDLGGAAWATGLVLLADGRPVVAGIDRGAAGDGLLVRYRTDGSLDPTFGSGGIVVTDLGTGADAAASVVLAPAPGGKLVAARTGGGPLACGQTLVRYLANGSPDKSFGTDGVVRDDTGSCDVDRALAIAPDGRIVTAGIRKGARARFVFVERRYDGTCGNGIPEPGEDCDGGVGCGAACCLADADGDGLCDAVDACTSPLPVDGMRLRVTAGRPGRMLGGSVRLSGSMAIEHPFDPLADGVRVLVGPSLDVTIPGGAYDASTRSGWVSVTSRATPRWSYRNRSGVPPEGVTRLSIREVTSTDPPVVRFEVQAGDGRYAELAAKTSVVTSIVLDPDRVPRLACGEVSFADDADHLHCRLKRSGGALTCH